MPNPYDLALRERAVTAYERGEGSYARLAALFDVDHRTLERWVARWRATQSVVPRPKGGGWSSPIDLAVLRAVVGEGPDATVTEALRFLGAGMRGFYATYKGEPAVIEVGARVFLS